MSAIISSGVSFGVDRYNNLSDFGKVMVVLSTAGAAVGFLSGSRIGRLKAAAIGTVAMPVFTISSLALVQDALRFKARWIG